MLGERFFELKKKKKKLRYRCRSLKKHDMDKDPSARKRSFSESACAIKLLSIHLTNSTQAHLCCSFFLLSTRYKETVTKKIEDTIYIAANKQSTNLATQQEALNCSAMQQNESNRLSTTVKEQDFQSSIRALRHFSCACITQGQTTKYCLLPTYT